MAAVVVARGYNHAGRQGYLQKEIEKDPWNLIRFRPAEGGGDLPSALQIQLAAVEDAPCGAPGR